MTGIPIRIAVTGLKQLRKSMAKASKKILGSISAAIFQKGLAILADSLKEVPRDKGFLAGSGYVAPPGGDKDPVVELGFGKKYGPAVHERRGVDHGPYKDHFLSDPINRHKSGYTRWIQGKARENARRGISWRGVPNTQPTRPSESRKA